MQSKCTRRSAAIIHVASLLGHFFAGEEKTTLLAHERYSPWESVHVCTALIHVTAFAHSNPIVNRAPYLVNTTAYYSKSGDLFSKSCVGFRHIIRPKTQDSVTYARFTKYRLAFSK